MASNPLILTRIDRRRLSAIVENAWIGGRQHRTGIRGLSRLLDRAVRIEPHEAPSDLVTMNCSVRINCTDTGEEQTVVLVYPEDLAVGESQVSVLGPLGLALLGARIGDEIKWEAPGGERIARVDSIVYQPEAAGELNR